MDVLKMTRKYMKYFNSVEIVLLLLLGFDLSGIHLSVSGIIILFFFIVRHLYPFLEELKIMNIVKAKFKPFKS